MSKAGRYISRRKSALAGITWYLCCKNLSWFSGVFLWILHVAAIVPQVSIACFPSYGTDVGDHLLSVYSLEVSLQSLELAEDLLATPAGLRSAPPDLIHSPTPG